MNCIEKGIPYSKGIPFSVFLSISQSYQSIFNVQEHHFWVSKVDIFDFKKLINLSQLLGLKCGIILTVNLMKKIEKRIQKKLVC